MINYTDWQTFEIASTILDIIKHAYWVLVSFHGRFWGHGFGRSPGDQLWKDGDVTGWCPAPLGQRVGASWWPTGWLGGGWKIFWGNQLVDWRWLNLAVWCCMYVYIYIFTYIYRYMIYIFTYIYIYIHIHTHIYTHTYIYTYISNHICVLVQVQLSIGCHRMSVADALDLTASGVPSPFSTLIACSALGMP